MYMTHGIDVMQCYKKQTKQTAQVIIITTSYHIILLHINTQLQTIKQMRIFNCSSQGCPLGDKVSIQ